MNHALMKAEMGKLADGAAVRSCGDECSVTGLCAGSLESRELAVFGASRVMQNHIASFNEGAMKGALSTNSFNLRVGGLSREELMGALSSMGVLLNEHAETLFASVAFDERVGQDVVSVERTVGELGLTTGAVLSQIFAAAQKQELLLCPPDTGPYLRLAWRTQRTAPDSLMSSRRAPTGAVTVASAPLSEDDEYPKGFYLRVVDGRPWLRGYQCDGQHVWSPEDTFAFQLPTQTSRTRGT
jgi:hypothetical protein